MERVTVVLLPGMHGTETLFGPLVAALPASWSVLPIGFPAEETGSTAVERVLTRWPPSTDDVFLIAESFSGPIAVRLAARRPPRLRGVVLVSTFPSSPAPGLRWLAALAGKWAPPIPAWAVRRYLTGKSAPASVVAEVHAAVRAMPPATLAARIATVANVNVRSALEELTVPVQLLYGTEDRLVSRAVFDAFPKNVERVEMRGAHLLLQTEPERSAEAIGAFVRRCLA